MQQPPHITHPYRLAALASIMVVTFILSVVVGIAGSYWLTINRINATEKTLVAAEYKEDVNYCQTIKTLATVPGLPGLSTFVANMQTALPAAYNTRTVILGSDILTCVQLTGTLPANPNWPNYPPPGQNTAPVLPYYP